MFEHLADTLQFWGEIVAEEYKNKLQGEDINASGKLSNSVKTVFTVNGNSYEVSLSLEDYWKQVEYGRQPTKNDGNGELRRNILEWIRVKPVIPTPFNGKLPTEEQLAYLISRKIHMYGYEGKQPLKRTIDELKVEIHRDIEEALSKDLSTDVLNILRTIDTE
jgi:hypothetical protein